MTTKYVEGLGENVIVNEARVDGKEAHHGDSIAPTKKDVENLIGARNLRK